MVNVYLGWNNCWAVKRWPLPEEWIEICRQMNVEYVQFSFDLLDPRTSEHALSNMICRIKDAASKYGVKIHSTFTGLAAYSMNLLTHPDAGMRVDALDWYRKAIEVTSLMGVDATGGHIAAQSYNDFKNPKRRKFIESILIDSVKYLSVYAKSMGLKMLLWEPMPVLREPPATIEDAKHILEAVKDEGGALVRLTIDLGHQCTVHVSEKNADPYSWLRELGAFSPVIHMQQTDGKGDRHWPFTEKYNKIGIIDPKKVIEAIESSGALETYLMLEYIPPFEEEDDRVLENLKESLKYLKDFI
ncbi:MAG: TIM barrel protein [Candidatus Bathyarchaeia archaeon]